MWRKLNEEEKQILSANYKFGAYIVRFMMGAWLLFVTIGYISGIRGAIESIIQGDYFSGIGSIVAGAIAAVMFFGVPILLIRNVGTEELQLLKDDDVYIGSALFISSRRSRKNGMKGRVRYFATVNLLDEWGNACSQVECRSIGNLQNSCKEGDRVTMLRIPKADGDELIAMKNNMLRV